MAGSNGHAEWTMPHVEVGQTVLWSWNGGKKDASPAVILMVGTSTLTLAIHATDTKDHVSKSGVRHADDPFLRRSPNNEGGVWRLTPRDERINEMLAAFEYKKDARNARLPTPAEALNP